MMYEKTTINNKLIKLEQKKNNIRDRARFIKCSRIQLVLYYYCPKCNAQYSFVKEDLRKGLVWNCGCGESFKIARIQSIKVKLNRHKQLKKPSQVDSAVRILVGMGYKKREVKGLCLQHKKLSKEEIIKKVILELNE